jgi:hypothetical protein
MEVDVSSLVKLRDRQEAYQAREGHLPDFVPFVIRARPGFGATRR